MFLRNESQFSINKSYQMYVNWYTQLHLDVNQLKQEVELQYSNLHKHKSSHFLAFQEKCLFGTFKAKFLKKPSLDFAKINFFLIYRPYSLNPKRPYPGSFFLSFYPLPERCEKSSKINKINKFMKFTKFK